MTQITSYATLQSSIADFLNRQDLTDQIPFFIQFCEADLNTVLRTRNMIKRSTTTSDEEFVALPTDFIEAINLQITDGARPLRFVTLDEADRIKKQQSYTDVAFYTMMNGSIELVPAPGDDVEIEMVYYAKVPALSDSNTSNWLLERAPDIYLYGSLIHAAVFLTDEKSVAAYGAIYSSRVASLNDDTQKAMHSGSPLIARVRR